MLINMLRTDRVEKQFFINSRLLEILIPSALTASNLFVGYFMQIGGMEKLTKRTSY